MKKFVALYRVSTQKQGNSGLGLEAQQDTVRSYVKSVGGVLISEITEVESGGNKDRIQFGTNINLDTLLGKRQQLRRAIELAKAEGATIVVKESSRLTRFSLLMDYLLANGIDFVCATSPNDTPLIIKFKTALAEEELMKISERTTAALQAKKNRGETWGKSNLSDQGRAKAIETNRAKALNNEHNRRAVSLITTLKSMNKTYQAIADQLNAGGFKTSRGGSFTGWAVQVLYQRHLTL
jgi:DNA invertase Pin-like site-specific DNA recombinase